MRLTAGHWSLVAGRKPQACHSAAPKERRGITGHFTSTFHYSQPVIKSDVIKSDSGFFYHFASDGSYTNVNVMRCSLIEQQLF